MALLVVPESLTPAERVSFILDDVFGYGFAEVVVLGRRPVRRRAVPGAHRRVRGSAVPDRGSLLGRMGRS